MLLRILRFKLTFFLILCGVMWPQPDYQLEMKDVRIMYLDFGVVNFLYDYHLFATKPGYITIAPFIFVDKRHKLDDKTLQHELVHFVQQKREGAIFYLKYGLYWLYNFIRYIPVLWDCENTLHRLKWASYYNIPYEKEGFAAGGIIVAEPEPCQSISAQSIGSSKNSFAREKCLHPKNPR